MPKENIDYSNTIIYKIFCKDENIKDFYIGHTTNFSQRKYAHKLAVKHNNSKLCKFIRENGGWINWNMIELSKHNCKNSLDAKMIEYSYHKNLKPTLNDIDIDTFFKNITSHKNGVFFEQLKITPKTPIENKNINFLCKDCLFSCSKKSDWERHILRKKHLEKINNDYCDHNEDIKMEFICDCGNIYKYKSGLIRHQKSQNCQKYLNVEKNKTNELNNINELTNLVLEVVKQNQELLILNNEAHKHNQELTNKIVEISKNVNNNTLINNHSNNKTFNLNVFLNETCKDAMNITDFLDSLQLQLSDLEYVGKFGFVEGISNIIVKNLKALEVHKRPVHCADKKREIIYIKNEDKWEKDNDEKNKLRSAIKSVAYKNEKLLPKYKELHPGCNFSESKYSDQYSKLVIEAMGGAGNNDAEKEDKIIQKIAKEVVIDKNFHCNN